MKPLRPLTMLILLGILSCDRRTENAVSQDSTNVRRALIDTSGKLKSSSIPDTVHRFKVDDYSVTNEMLVDKKSNSSSYKKQSGQTFSYDKAWFENDTLKQTLVFELYTDYHRAVTYHFYNNDIPIDLISSIEFHVDGGELASKEQKVKDFKGFIKQSTEIRSLYFTTNKGFRLGDTKQKAFDIYGKPDSQKIANGIEKLEWTFEGDTSYDGKANLNGKPLAKDSFGHHVVMYFKNGKLAGHILYNDIP